MLQEFLKSLFGQFIIGGTTVSGISYLSNNMNPLLSGIFGGIPIGLPSSIFVNDKKVVSYLENLSFMTIILSVVTILAYYFVKYKKMKKNKAVLISMIFWFILAGLYYLFRRIYG